MPHSTTQRLRFFATVVGSADPLTAEQLARACGAHLGWIRELADAGLLPASEQPVEAWRFEGHHLGVALEVRRLQRDFDASLDAAALIVDMGREIRRLRALTAVAALRPGIP